MKTYFFLFALLPLLSVSMLSCTNSHDDDVIIYVPRQVRETPTGQTNPKEVILLTILYDSQYRPKSEADADRTANIYYSIDSSIDSVSFIPTNTAKDRERKELAAALSIPEADVSVTDSTRAIYTHSGSDIAIKLYTYRSKNDHDTTAQKITLNAEMLPISYTYKNSEKRYSYADSTLTTIEHYDNSVLAWTRSYEYSTSDKSPYCEVPDYPAWYFVVYRYISPKGFTTKCTYTASGSSAAIEYELSDITTSDLEFVTKCTKTYYEKSGNRIVTYRQDYRKLALD